MGARVLGELVGDEQAGVVGVRCHRDGGRRSVAKRAGLEGVVVVVGPGGGLGVGVGQARRASGAVVGVGRSPGGRDHCLARAVGVVGVGDGLGGKPGVGGDGGEDVVVVVVGGGRRAGAVGERLSPSVGVVGVMDGGQSPGGVGDVGEFVFRVAVGVGRGLAVAVDALE